jgi:hypothetical protein
MVAKMTQTYDPNWNPDDYDMTLKYEPMNSSKINNILSQYKNDEVLSYIKELWNLIDYQRKIISKQTQEIVAIKHKVVWKRYEKGDSVFTEHLDKPQRTDTMSC